MARISAWIIVVAGVSWGTWAVQRLHHLLQVVRLRAALVPAIGAEATASGPLPGPTAYVIGLELRGALWEDGLAQCLEIPPESWERATTRIGAAWEVVAGSRRTASGDTGSGPTTVTWSGTTTRVHIGEFRQATAEASSIRVSLRRIPPCLAGREAWVVVEEHPLRRMKTAWDAQVLTILVAADAVVVLGVLTALIVAWCRRRRHATLHG